MTVAETLVVRPQRVRRYAIPAAVALVVIFVVVAVLLRSGSTGVQFGASDQVALGAIGVVLACGVLLFVRPRVVADADGVEVRNILFGQKVPWSMIKGVSFP
ncbi:MAG TPA: PH domain-containing protein, partial [Pseudonocardiaceae bacterium]